MISTFLFLLSAGLEGFCQNGATIPARPLISLWSDDLSIYTIRQEIFKQTGIHVGANELLDKEQGFSVHLKKVGIDSCLKTVLQGSGLGYTQYDPTTFIIYRRTDAGTADELVLRGSVRNKEGEPLAGASVAINGTGHGTMTDEQGLFNLGVLSRNRSLQVSFTGYQTVLFDLPRRIINVADAGAGGSAVGGPVGGAGAPRHYLDIVLERDGHSLDGVVVEAYSRTTRRLNTGDIEQLSGEDIRKEPVGNFLAALEGRMPGLVSTQPNGVPGSSINVQTRGQNSLFQGNTPLIVIDGVPLPPNNGSLSFIPSGSAYGLPGMSPLYSYSAAEIEHIEILKDAEATAIYGSRGANGVLLITTKKSKPGPLRLAADLSFGLSRAINTPHLLNSAQYATMRTEALTNDGLPADSMNAPDLVLRDRNTDYKKMVLGNRAIYQDARVSASGGDSLFSYLVSGNEHRESTPFPGSPGDLRLSAFAALRYHPFTAFTIQGSTLYCTVDDHLPVLDPSQFIYLAPDAPGFYDANWKFVWQQNNLSFLNIAAQQLNSYHAFTKNFFTHWDLNYELLPGLNAKVSLGYNSVKTTESSIEPIAAQDPSVFPTGTYFGGTTTFTGLIAEPQLEYSRKKGWARWDMLAGASWEDQHSRLGAVVAQGYTDDAYLGMPNKAQSLVTQDSSTLYLYEALFAQARLDLADKYIFSASGRRDGSSRFGPGHQFGNFGSVGAAWIFNKENFFPDIPWLSFGKLRGSYGVTGNDQIGDYRYAQSWIRSITQPYGGLQGVYPATPGNPMLGWEQVHKLEGALELGAFHDRLFLSAAWYRDWSGNQLMYTPIPVQTGYQGVIANLPVVLENTGWEFSLHSQQQLSPKLSWNSAFSLTIPRNCLKSFPGLANSGYAGSLAVGKSVNTIRAYQYTGVDPNTGLYQFRDLNKNGMLDDNDRVFGGNTDLRAYAGWNNEFSYKGWQLTFFVEGRKQQGYDALVQLFAQTPLGTATSPGMLLPGLLDNEPVEVLQRWQHPGDQQPLQQFTATPGSPAADTLNYYIHSDAQLRDASFIRVKMVALSYSLPPAILTGLHLRGAKVYLQGQNLFTITHYPVTDPETQNPLALPPMRTMVVGVQLNF